MKNQMEHATIESSFEEKKVTKMGKELKKAILRELDGIEYESSFTVAHKQRLIEEYGNKLKRHLTSQLKDVKYDLTDKIQVESDKNLAESFIFKKKIVERAMELRRVNGKKMPVERNYAEAPLFNANNPTAHTLVELKNADGEIIEERKGYRKINYKSEHGYYLKSSDFRIFAGLQRMWELKGGKKMFSFDFKELCEVIDYEAEGGSFDLIDQSLIKLSTTSIIMEDYRDVQLNRRIRTVIHNIIQSADVDRENKRATVIFNDYLHQGLEEKNVVRINLSIFQDLSTVTAKLLYPLLTSLLKDNKSLLLDDLIHSLGLHKQERKDVLKRIRIALDDLREYKVIKNYELIKVGRSFKYVHIEPSQQLLEALEEGIVVST